MFAFVTCRNHLTFLSLIDPQHSLIRLSVLYNAHVFFHCWCGRAIMHNQQRYVAIVLKCQDTFVVVDGSKKIDTTRE